ncbi:MAG: hypothetical protein MUC98_15865, partial [Desulfobacterota bacterium]|nr:hypothetical protein [Thermodesulfobacteriota bacterium]
MKQRFETSAPDQSEIAALGLTGAGSSEVLEFLKDERDSLSLRGLERSALGYLVAAGLKTLRRPWLIVAPTEREAETFAETVSFFLGRENSKPDQALSRR